MYRDYSAAQWRNYLKLPTDYMVDGVLVFGSNESYAYKLMDQALERTNVCYSERRLKGEYLQPVMEVRIDDKTLWFIVAYGGAQLSEFLHLACSFGSRANILLGNCGGLKKGVEAYDLIIPTYSYATESSATTYQPDVDNQFASDSALSNALESALKPAQTVHRDKTTTCQAMFGESTQMVQTWANDGYAAVEMEAATVFAVSSYFKVPAAAVLKVIDNLAKSETIVENGYQPTEKSHADILDEMFDAALEQLIRIS